MRHRLSSAVAIILVVAGIARGDATTQPAKAVEVGDSPSLSFNAFNGGQPIALSDYRGKALLVEFSATWCPGCMAQWGRVTALREKYMDQLGIIWVSLDDNKERLTRFIAEKQVDFPVQFEGKGWDNPVYNAWYAGRNEGIPRSYVIEADGKVSFITFDHHGIEEAVADAVARANSLSGTNAR